MFFDVLLAYLPYACVSAFTPGPNNILALYSVGQAGWRKGKYALMGMGAGFLCMMLACAFFCYELDQYMPWVTGVLKYVGAAYILYLALHIALSRPEDQKAQQVTLGKGFLLQFVNVKEYLYAITVYSGYVLGVTTRPASLALHGACLTAIGLAGIVTWAFMGSALQKFIAKYHRPFNLAMAAILVYCAIRMFV